MPMIMAIVEKVLLYGLLIFHPMNAADIPKKSKLKPTMIEISSDENMGNIIKSKPRIIANNPALLLTIHLHLHLIN